MTQPCHKDTALNQQCRDREHKWWKGEEGRQCKRDKNNVKGRTQSEHGDNTQPAAPAIQKGHRVNDKGDANTRTGGRQHSTGSQ
nr:MAG TPA: hypothetical protein [Caudoviricetes sp.]